MNKPMFSIIIPVYKVEKYLEQCINSVLSQTFTDFEIILVDDGSPDNSGEICDNYANKDDRVKVIHKENGGLSSARNAGLRAATGEYVFFLDSDDFWKNENVLTKMAEKLVLENVDVLIFGIEKYYPSRDCYIEKVTPNMGIKSENKEERLYYLMRNNFFVASACDKVVKKSFLQDNEIDFVKGQLSEDIEWCAKILLYDPVIDVIPEMVYVYRQENMSSITSNIGRKNLEDIEKIILKYSKYKDNKLLLYYLEQEYVLWMTASTHMKKSDIKDLISEMKELWSITKYGVYPYARIVRKLRFLGFDIIRFLLGLYKKVKR